MPDLIRHPVLPWIPAFAGMTGLVFIVAGVIKGFIYKRDLHNRQKMVRKRRIKDFSHFHELD
jgi:hypothetical protein